MQTQSSGCDTPARHVHSWRGSASILGCECAVRSQVCLWSRALADGNEKPDHCVCACRTQIRLIFANLTADDILIQDLLDELQATSQGQFQVCLVVEMLPLATVSDTRLLAAAQKLLAQGCPAHLSCLRSHSLMCLLLMLLGVLRPE